jgi:hypothetical protein
MAADMSFRNDRRDPVEIESASYPGNSLATASRISGVSASCPRLRQY